MNRLFARWLLVLYGGWIATWCLFRFLETRVTLLQDPLVATAWWTVAKLVVWVLPVLVFSRLIPLGAGSLRLHHLRVESEPHLRAALRAAARAGLALHAGRGRCVARSVCADRAVGLRLRPLASWRGLALGPHHAALRQQRVVRRSDQVVDRVKGLRASVLAAIICASPAPRTSFARRFRSRWRRAAGAGAVLCSDEGVFSPIPLANGVSRMELRPLSPPLFTPLCLERSQDCGCAVHKSPQGELSPLGRLVAPGVHRAVPD